MKIKRAVTVTFPAPLPAEIKCPICEGNKCKVCDMTGKIKVTLDAKKPIQPSHIVKYIVENGMIVLVLIVIVIGKMLELLGLLKVVI